MGRAVMEFTFSPEDTPQAAARAFASQQGFTATGQEATTVNGNQAYALTGTANTQQGELAIAAYFIQYGGAVYRFMGLTGANTFSQYRDEFLSTFRSFQRLTNREYLNRQPVRLDVVRTDRAAAFQSFLRGRPSPTGMDENTLAIMNFVQLNETVPAGTALKLPRN